MYIPGRRVSSDDERGGVERIKANQCLLRLKLTINSTNATTTFTYHGTSSIRLPIRNVYRFLPRNISLFVVRYVLVSLCLQTTGLPVRSTRGKEGGSLEHRAGM